VVSESEGGRSASGGKLELINDFLDYYLDSTFHNLFAETTFKPPLLVTAL